MSHPDAEVVHMLSGHHVTGVNWRPIRFTKQLPSSLICCLCRVVPEMTAMLPCSHFLCDSCCRARRQDGHDTCPLDGKPYGTRTIYYAADKASSLQAHCWNEGNGCKYVGPIEALVLHYDKECTFHAIQCQRCKQRILRRNIAAHYEAGCPRNASCSSDADPSKQTSMPASSDAINSAISAFENSLQRRIERIETNIGSKMTQLNTRLQELKALIRDPCGDQLSSVQSQMNALVEQARSNDAFPIEENWHKHWELSEEPLSEESALGRAGSCVQLSIPNFHGIGKCLGNSLDMCKAANNIDTGLLKIFQCTVETIMKIMTPEGALSVLEDSLVDYLASVAGALGHFLKASLALLKANGSVKDAVCDGEIKLGIPSNFANCVNNSLKFCSPKSKIDLAHLKSLVAANRCFLKDVAKKGANGVAKSVLCTLLGVMKPGFLAIPFVGSGVHAMTLKRICGKA
ncbi:hypothetical protein MTO96_024911, partial [Rhipicephalus appendiculatus]